MKTSLLSILAVSCIALTGHAQMAQPSPTPTGDSSKEVKEVKQVVTAPPTCVFRDTEIQLDGFAEGIFGSKHSHFATGPGGGFGVNVFFLRYFGIGYEGEWYSNRGEAQHMPIAGNLFFRYPICAWHLAPYLMVGGGGTWDGYGTGYGDVGGGSSIASPIMSVSLRTAGISTVEPAMLPKFAAASGSHSN